MRSTKSRMLLTLVALTVLYILLGRLALVVAIPPGNASALWPAAGLAFGACMLCGYWVWRTAS
jgi:integral membrane sensor domain MASE1